MKEEIASIRKDYQLKCLSENEVLKTPVEQFSFWWNEAVNSNISEVNAMTLATASKDGTPHARIVLLKSFDEGGFIFFTNYQSNKGVQLAENNKAALIFFWKELERQVRIEGFTDKISAKESDEYFDSRPPGSRIGASISPQSTVINGRSKLEEKFKKLSAEFPENILRPEFWGGYVVKPISIEFWQGRRNRLHDRILYTKENENWKIERLAP